MLTPRLDAIARLAGSGKRIVDVGTDHGYVPIWLALQGRAESITATDIRPGPLEKAKRAARENGVQDRIRFVLCDGLGFDGAPESDTVIMAGMGGETIIAILERAAWTQSGVRLILQPQSKADELCVWLAQNGFRLEGAELTEDAGRLYTLLSVTGADGALAAIYVEEALLAGRDPMLRRWLTQRTAALKKAAEGMARARESRDTAYVEVTLARLARAAEEADKWQP